MEKESPNYVDKLKDNDHTDEKIHYVEFEDLPEEYREAAQDLQEANPKVFNGLNSTQKIEVIKTVGLTSIRAMSHSGPLPDPESLGHYNEIITNGADRIMAMAENQQQHRIFIEKKVI